MSREDLGSYGTSFISNGVIQLVTKTRNGNFSYLPQATTNRPAEYGNVIKTLKTSAHPLGSSIHIPILRGLLMQPAAAAAPV